MIQTFLSIVAGILLIVVTVFSGLFNFYQDVSSSAIMESFKKMVPKYANVIRDGVKYFIPSEEIVIGKTAHCLINSVDEKVS